MNIYVVMLQMYYLGLCGVTLAIIEDAITIHFTIYSRT